MYLVNTYPIVIKIWGKEDAAQGVFQVFCLLPESQRLFFDDFQ
jgi:hypothetical protein